MNYYCIEFFKFYIKELKNLNNKGAGNSRRSIDNILNRMSAFIQDREQNNACAYNTKHMRKPKFNL
ncbi:hypothetical protein EBR43_11520 [bacterium]|nr:hypothetical protein [bacterium]